MLVEWIKDYKFAVQQPTVISFNLLMRDLEVSAGFHTQVELRVGLANIIVFYWANGVDRSLIIDNLQSLL